MFGRVEISGQGPVAGAEVFCVPFGYQPVREPDHASLTTRTDADGEFEFSSQPEAVGYSIMAYTASHYGELTSLQPDSRNGRILVQIRPLYYTSFEFVDAEGGPVAVPKGQLSVGSALASTHRPHVEASVERILRRMGVVLPALASNRMITVFRTPLSSRESTSVVLQLPGHKPTRVSQERWLLSEWPRRQTVTLRAAPPGNRVLYTLRFPDRDWPAAWGKPIDRLDHRMFYLTGDRVFRSVSRRNPVFVLGRREEFQLEDQNGRVLSFRIENDTECRKYIVPEYPGYGMLEVKSVPEVSSAKLFHLILRPEGEPSALPIEGVSLVPGTTRFGPLQVGSYELTLERGFSVSALQLVRRLGRVEVKKGFHVHRMRIEVRVRSSSPSLSSRRLRR